MPQDRPGCAAGRGRTPACAGSGAVWQRAAEAARGALVAHTRARRTQIRKSCTVISSTVLLGMFPCNGAIVGAESATFYSVGRVRGALRERGRLLERCRRNRWLRLRHGGAKRATCRIGVHHTGRVHRAKQAGTANQAGRGRCGLRAARAISRLSVTLLGEASEGMRTPALERRCFERGRPASWNADAPMGPSENDCATFPSFIPGDARARAERREAGGSCRDSISLDR